jgi:hypothetical protein
MPPGDETVDFTLTKGWMRKQAERDRTGGPPGGPPSGGGTDDLGPRVGALEAAIGRLDGRIGKLEDKVDGVIKDIAEIKGRLSQMPTTFQMLTWLVGVAIALTGLVYAVARTTAPH